MGEHDGVTEVYATEPIVLDQPVRRLHRLRWVLVLWGVAIVVCSVVAAFVVWVALAQRIANDQAQHAANGAQVEHQIAQQQATNSAQAGQFEQLREALCALIQRVPPDPEINRQRALYKCGPYLPPSSPARSKTPPPAGQPSPHPTGGPTPRPTPVPTPHPTPTLTPAPPQQGGPILCLLGICL